jgi:hypothetical protein
MSVLEFEDYRQMSDYLKAHGRLPTDHEVRVGSRVILPGRVTHVFTKERRA